MMMMGNQNEALVGGNLKNELIPFPITYQFPTPDLRGNGYGYLGLDWADELAFPWYIMEPDALYETLAIEPTPSVQDYEFYDIKKGLGLWNEIYDGFDSDKAVYVESGKEVKEQERGVKREETSGSTKLLSRKTISQYFYMPITQAAKELNVGLTLLKKRCRELGIRRWPHRKLMSLQTLMNNVKELGKEGGQESEEKLRDALEILAKEKKMMEEMPDLQLEVNTKRLRQACFKANYKKRKLMVSSMESECTKNEYDNYEDQAQDIKLLLPSTPPHFTA